MLIRDRAAAALAENKRDVEQDSHENGSDVQIVKKCRTCLHIEKPYGQYPCCECSGLGYEKWEPTNDTH